MEKIDKKISKDIKDILKKLNENGKGYIIGGYLRDLYLGYKPKDCDFSTDIPYEKLKNIFKDYGAKEIGKTFGIIQIFYKGKYYEIAKLRKEVKFSERRNEVEIDFIDDIYEDLKRRDLTINSLAYDGEKIYTLLDEVRKDFENRVEEDPLRILRIAYDKKLKIEKNSYLALKKYKKLLKRLNIECLFKILKCEKVGEKILELSKKEKKSIKIVLHIIKNDKNIKNKIEIKKILKDVDIDILKMSLSFFENEKKFI